MIDPLGIARHLGLHGVRYVLVGGSAMRARGMQYATEDYDICYDTNEANVERLIRALDQIDPVLRIESRGVTMPFHLAIHTLRGSQIVTLATSLGNVDLRSSVVGVGDYGALLTRCSGLTIGDDVVPVMRYEALVDSKRAAGRGKDLFVLRNSKRLQKSNVGYSIEVWTAV